MSTIENFMEEFFEEFQYRIDQIASIGDDDIIKKDMLFILVENLMLKYENRIQQKRGLFSKIFPFLSNGASDFDPDFEEQINHELELLMTQEMKQPKSARKSVSKAVNSTLNRNFKQVFNGSQNLPIVIKPGKIERLSDYLTATTVPMPLFSKTNIPSTIDIALELNPLPGKGQDHLDYFISADGNIAGIIICDGVSGDGPLSTKLAQHLPRSLSQYILDQFHEHLHLQDWKEIITSGLEDSLASYTYDGGASTVLVGLVDSKSDQIYVAYMGDGNILCFNNKLTGFSKLLNPHQNAKGRLTRVVTHQGLIGQPDVQILSSSGGSLILSSDGYNLSNGQILRHFYQEVLKQNNLQDGLYTWANEACCEQNKVHPNPTDDRSIGVLRWK